MRLEFHDLVEKIIKTCLKRDVDRLLIENKANGISVAQEIVRLCSGEKFGVTLIDPRQAGGDKVARAYAIQHLFENGLVYAPERGWAEKVIAECEVFPKGAHDDQVDCLVQAIWWLRKHGMALLAREDTQEKSWLSAKQLKSAWPGRDRLYDV